MFKRANKITALLVAAAAVVSVLPATAANAADAKRIASEDGIVYNAVAYKDGKFIFDGEVKDEDGAYYLANGKYTELDDVDSGADYSVYGSKYVKVDDGDYFVDLTNGKVTDDSLDEDDEDDAASALRKKVKDVDRYDDNANIPDLEIIPGAKFGDTWYSTQSYTGYNVYTDAKGGYIDADYNIGKIKVGVTSDAGTKVVDTITVDDTKDEETGYKVGSENTIGVKASIVEESILGQDSNNVYRYAKLTLTAKKTTKAGVSVSPEIATVNGKEVPTQNGTVTLPVIQKISKAQDSDDVDDAKYAKTVTTYIVSDDDAKLVDDAKDLFDLLEETTGKDPAVKASIVNGKVMLYGKVAGKDQVVAQIASLKSKNGYYYTSAEGQSKEDTEYNEDLEKLAIDTDVDGNLWRVDGGFVYKFDNTDDWEKVYKVDGSMDSISVYDKNNMIVWNQGDEVYSIISGKSSEEDKDDTTTTTTGWVEANGAWTYVNADGTKATGWLNLNGTWYYLDPATGAMATGWVNVNGTWYYLNPVSDGTKGAMKTGWVNAGGTWYYLNASGAMLTGWINDNGTWYYCNASGAMLANTVVDGYKLGANGAWVK